MEIEQCQVQEKNLLRDLRSLFISLKQKSEYLEIPFGCYDYLINDINTKTAEIQSINRSYSNCKYSRVDYIPDDTDGYTNGKIEILIVDADVDIQELYTLTLKEYYNGDDDYFPVIHIARTTVINEFNMAEDQYIIEDIEKNFTNNIAELELIKKQKELDRLIMEQEVINKKIEQLKWSMNKAV